MKSLKILTFGNSYSVDAYAWLCEIFASQGYELELGQIVNGGCNINHHYSNVDSDLENDFGATFLYKNTKGDAHSVCVGESMPQKKIYEDAISLCEWDYVVIQHGPKHVELVETYSHLDELIAFIKAHLLSPRTKLIYHMIWKYNDYIPNAGTAQFYPTIIDITREFVMKRPEFEGVIPAATMRQNLVSSYLTDKDVARDYGHMGLGFGRLVLGILWYCFFTGEDPECVSFRPRISDISAGLLEKYTFDEVKECDMNVAYEAIRNALSTPFSVTPSKFSGDGSEDRADARTIDEHIGKGNREKVE